jgi:hypothetical protein
VGDFGNQGNGPVVDGLETTTVTSFIFIGAAAAASSSVFSETCLHRHREANRRCLTRNVGAQPNAAAADKVSLSTSVINYIASDRNMLFSNDLIPVSSLQNNTIAPAETDTAKTDTIVDHLMKAVDVAEPEAAARFQRVVNQIMQRQDEITGDVQRYFRNYLALAALCIFVGY